MPSLFDDFILLVQQTQLTDLERLHASTDETDSSYANLVPARAALRAPSGSLPWHRYKDLETQAVIAHELDGASLEPLMLLRALADGGGRQNFIGFEHADIWLAAIRACLIYNLRHQSPFADSSLYQSLNGRALNVTRGVRLLRDAGFCVTVRDGVPSNNTQMRTIESALLARVKEHPNLHLALLNEELAKRYDSINDRYTFTRVFDTQTSPKTHGSYPLGHLYLVISTAIQNITSTAIEPTLNDRERALSTWELYRAFFALMNTEIWLGPAETLTSDPPSTLRVLRERIVYEHNFMLRQQTPEQTLAIINGVFNPFRATKYMSVMPFTIDDCVCVISAILANKRGNGPLRFTAAQVAASCGLDVDHVAPILAALAFRAGSRNAADLSMADLSVGDAMYYPLIQLRDGYYLMLDRLIAGPAFYEAIASALRATSLGKAVDEIVGKDGLEHTVRDMLAKRGISALSGRYGSDDLECDAVIETKDTILFLEVKKKGLTRKSLSGSLEQALFDTSSSLLESQLQLVRHEYNLRTSGVLRFHNGTTLHLEGRRILRVAISLLELGSLQDKIFLTNMLKDLRGAKFYTNRTLEDNERLAVERFERVARLLLDYYNKVKGLFPAYDSLERFVTRSFSTVELMERLLDASNASDLVANIDLDAHTTTGTGDWHAEYKFMKDARQQAAGT